MSGPNASLSLPPGDREDLTPHTPSGDREDSSHPVAGREPQFDFGPAFAPALGRIGATLDEAQMALGDLKLALTRNDLPAVKAAAWRLSEAMIADPRAQAANLRKLVMNPRGKARANAEA